MTIHRYTLLGLTFGLLSPFLLSAATVDDYLREKLDFFRITKYDSLPEDHTDEYQSKVNLGRRLYFDINLSGNRNINCLTCHHPMTGLSDGRALSQTEDGKGILRRNSSSLYNVGERSNTFMFWDGRVHYHPTKKVFTTPEPSLNGDNPASHQITSVMTSALAAQAIFPLLSAEEMRGKKGDNEIADAKTNLEAWDKIIKRVTTENDYATYINLFNRAYPDTVNNVQKINIGHAGEAMATFMRQEFQSNTSPFHLYLAGDNEAMTDEQKRGLLVFIERGNCIACHQGSLLGNNQFFSSVGVPGFGAKPFTADRGRGEVAEKFKDFFFKVPSLINVALSAPYMHNGAFRTIREVLNHYNNIRHSLHHFEISDERRKKFPVDIEALTSVADINGIFNSMQAGFLRRGLGLSPQELDDLEIFLTEGLTDPKWSPAGKKKAIRF